MLKLRYEEKRTLVHSWWGGVTTVENSTEVPQKLKLAAFLVVRWLRTACKAGHMGLIPGWGTMIPHAMKSRSPRAATTEPAGSEASAPQPESTQHRESLQ